jgi:hypothetical protein
MKKVLIFSLILASHHRFFAQTFSSGIAEIFYNRCTSCHRSGGIAPFNILTYQDVQNNAGGIYDAIVQDRMPPWPPENSYSQLLHSRALSATEKTTLINWMNSGMPEGNSAQTPPPPVFSSSSVLGQGDLELQIPMYTSAATAQNDDYVCISVPTGLTAGKKIRAMEVLPGNPAIVHHCLIYIDETGDYQTNTSGTCTGPVGSSYKLAGGYVPGTMPMVFPNNAQLKLGQTIPAGSNIVFAMHFPAGSGGQQDNTKVIFHFYPDNTTGIRELQADPVLQSWQFNLPANQVTTVNAQQNIPSNISIFSIFPHMHLLGKSIKAYALDQGDTIKLINIPKWDFHWQGFYVFKNLKKLPQGSSLRGQGVYDNTATNIHNPSNPPVAVGPGLNTNDEMFIFYGHYMPYQAGDENYDLEEMVALNLTEYLQQDSREIKMFPNPFSHEVSFDLSKIAYSSSLSTAIYDTQGKLIKILNFNGQELIIWDGKNNLGAEVPSGVYQLSILVDGNKHLSKPIVKM